MNLRLSIKLITTSFTLFALVSCNSDTKSGTDEVEIKLAIVGQSLIKIDPRKHWENPYASIKPILETADIGFTNFEMAVDNDCGLPAEYQVVLGKPSLKTDRPGNTGGPHAVHENVMAFLSSMNFNLQSLANNHSWDLGGCGVEATIAAANKYGVVHAGTGNNIEEATKASIIEVNGAKIALIASTTSRDERDLILPKGETAGVNGVWTGWAEDWNRNIEAVKSASKIADFVIYYQHFQIDQEDASGEGKYGHSQAGDMFKWQEKFAKEILDSGAGMFIAHGDRIFDGVEIYKGKPIFRQFGGFSYQGLQDIGAYDPLVWEGLLGMLTIKNGAVHSIQILPLALNEGIGLEDLDPVELREKRGLSEVATGVQGTEILRRFKDLSAKYGAIVTIEGDKAIIEFEVN